MENYKTKVESTPLDYLEEIPELALDVIADAIKENFKEIKASASSFASEDHGFLKKSMNYKIKKYKKDKSVWGVVGVESKKFIDPVTGEIVNPALYGRFIEYGTTSIQAEPFMRPAVERVGGNDGIDDDIAKQTQLLVETMCNKNNKTMENIS